MRMSIFFCNFASSNKKTTLKCVRHDKDCNKTMANKKQLDYKQVRGIELVITNNPYGEKITSLLEFPIYVGKNEKGEYVAYYFSKDMLDGELEYAVRRHLNFEYKLNKDVLLVDKVPAYLKKYEMSFEKFVAWQCQSVETEYDMSGKYSAESQAKRKAKGKVYGDNEYDEWGKPVTYDCAKVYSVNEYRANGHF